MEGAEASGTERDPEAMAALSTLSGVCPFCDWSVLRVKVPMKVGM